MPDDNFIIRHWQTELQSFHQNLLLLQQELATEAIHDLRVAIKKLRSYLKLYAALSKKKNTEQGFEKTEELFSVLGKYQNIEVSRKLVLSFFKKNDSVLTSLLSYLQSLQDQTRQYCRQALDKYEDEQLTGLTLQLEQDLGVLDEEQLNQKMATLLRSYMKIVKQDLKNFDKRFHRIRKQLKDIFYWSKISPIDLVFSKSQLKMMEKILDHLGAVQDHEVLNANLGNFRKTILANETPESIAIKKSEQRVERKKIGLLQKAQRMIKEL